MTQEEKLKTLLQIAVDNGYNNIDIEDILKPKRLYEGSFFISKDSSQISWGDQSGMHNAYSLDQLVGQWEDNEVSFIGALCSTIMSPTFLDCDFIGTEITSSKDYDNAVVVRRLPYSTLDYQQQVRFVWSNTSSSKRLDELFRIFNHLLKTEDR